VTRRFSFFQFFFSLDSSYGNLREVIQESRYCGKFFDVVPLKRCGRTDRVRYGEAGQDCKQAGSGQRGGAGRLTGLILMVLVGGRASVRNAAETFGLERELMEALGELDDAWRSCQAGEGSGRHHGRHRGPQRSRGRDVSP